MSRGPDAATLLRRAIESDAAAAGCAIAIGDTLMIRWASATFAGARHTIGLAGADDAALAAWIAGLPDADLPIRGHVVADLSVVSIVRGGDEARIEIEALTVEV